MMDEDPEFEQHLRSFKPWAVAPLVFPRRRLAPAWSLAATAAILAIGFLVFRPERRGGTPETNRERVPITVMEFHNAAERGQLDEALSHAARATLPRTDQSSSALNILAKD